jgi:hypothetical protein
MTDERQEQQNIYHILIKRGLAILTRWESLRQLPGLSKYKYAVLI